MQQAIDIHQHPRFENDYEVVKDINIARTYTIWVDLELAQNNYSEADVFLNKAVNFLKNTPYFQGKNEINREDCRYAGLYYQPQRPTTSSAYSGLNGPESKPTTGKSERDKTKQFGK